MSNNETAVDRSWIPFEQGRTLGHPGNEGGIVVQDEHHVDGARITLESDASAAPFAITCGISGWLVHTRFFREEPQAVAAYDAMKHALEQVLGLIHEETPTVAEDTLPVITASIEQFLKRFP